MPAALLLAAALAATPPQGGVLPGEAAAYDDMLVTQARAANKTFTGTACDDAKVEVVSITPWRIADHPGLIVWREKVRVTGCGHSLIENINVGRFGGAPPWGMTTGLPGASIGDMNLQRSTFPAAVAQAETGLSECKTVSLSDVYLAAKPGGVDVSPPGVPPTHDGTGRPALELPGDAAPILDQLSLADAWMEVWPLVACGHDRTLGVVFIPFRGHQTSIHVFLPVWEFIEAHGQGARPAPVPADE